jgi:aspartokinase
MFTQGDILEVEDDLAAIIVHSPEEIIKTPGCAIAFYNQLARRHINIEDTVSCYTDTIMLVKMDQVGKAFNALTDLISNSRKMPRKKHHHQQHR